MTSALNAAAPEIRSVTTRDLSTVNRFCGATGWWPRSRRSSARGRGHGRAGHRTPGGNGRTEPGEFRHTPLQPGRGREACGPGTQSASGGGACRARPSLPLRRGNADGIGRTHSNTRLVMVHARDHGEVSHPSPRERTARDPTERAIGRYQLSGHPQPRDRAREPVVRPSV